MSLDREIVEGIKRKDENAFNILVDIYGGVIKSIVIYHMRGFLEYTDECINDVLLSVWNNIESYDSEKNSLKNWLGAIAKYKCIDYKKKYFKDLSLCELDENIVDQRNYVMEDMSEEIESILSCLSDEDRGLFYRYYIIGESIKEISQKSGRSKDYLFNRLSRGRKRIRKHLQRSERI